MFAKFVQFMLTNADTFDRIAFVVERTSQPAAVAQSVERRIGSAEVTGPIPVSSFLELLNFKGSFFFVLHFSYFNYTFPTHHIIKRCI